MTLNSGQFLNAKFNDVKLLFYKKKKPGQSRVIQASYYYKVRLIVLMVNTKYK